MTKSVLTSTGEFVPVDLKEVDVSDLPQPLARVIIDLANNACRSENHTNHSYHSDQPAYDHSRDS